MAKKVLGISAFYHDSAAAIAVDGKIVAAAHEERFSRIKQDPAFPRRAARYCLREAGIGIKDLDAVVFYDKPLLKFERLLESQYDVAPRGLGLFVRSMPIWIKEKLFLKRLIRGQLKKVDKDYDSKEVPLLFTEHHLSHAASAFYPSPFKEAAILTLDGVGEWATASFCHGRGNSIEVLRELHFPDSVGLLYSAFTWFLGFRVNSGEYKMMGLAPYGDEASPFVDRYRKLIKKVLVKIHNDGSIKLNPRYFTFRKTNRLIRDEQWEKLFGMERRRSDVPVMKRHANLALAAQRVIEEIVIRMARSIRKETGSKNLCLAGGVALNSVLNGKLELAEIFDNIWVQPAAGDAGGALGAALAGHHIFFGQPRDHSHGGEVDGMSGSLLGPAYAEEETIRMAEHHDAVYERLEDDQLLKQVAKVLAEGYVVGWFQGRMEFGPRALGSRSILADPRSADVQRTLNVRVKFRESFRPFAPAVMAEYAQEIFEGESPSPYMALVRKVRHRFRKVVPWDYNTFTIKEKLHTPRSDFQAVTHVDFSARVQSVTPESNPRFYQLLKAFHEQTECPVLVNTSFNLRGQPIVRTPEDAFWCFMNSEMDYLVVGNIIFDKRNQPLWEPIPLFTH